MPSFVTEGDLTPAESGGGVAPMPWCEDGDVVEGWAVLQNSTSQQCLSLDSSRTGLVAEACDAARSAQRWRRPVPDAPWSDSRLESGAAPGVCAMLPLDDATGVRDGVLVVGPCLGDDGISAAPSGEADGTPDEDDVSAAYAPSLRLVALQATAGTWTGDEETVNELLWLLWPQSRAVGMSGSVGAASLVAAGRMRGQVPHCNLAGVLCNGMGRVTHLDMATFAEQRVTEPPEAAAATAALRLALSLPWLVATSWAGLPLRGPLPYVAEATPTPTLVRAVDVSRTGVNGTLASDWATLPALALVNLTATLCTGPLPLGWLTAAPAVSVDLTRVALEPAGNDAALCLPFDPAAALEPVAVTLELEAASAPLARCDRFVAWSVELEGALACALYAVCAGASGNGDSLRQRTAAARAGGHNAYQLSCSAACASVSGPVDAGVASVGGIETARLVGGAAIAPAPSVARRLLRDLTRSTRGHPRRRLRDAVAASNTATVDFTTLSTGADAESGAAVLAALFPDVLSAADVTGGTLATLPGATFRTTPGAAFEVPGAAGAGGPAGAPGGVAGGVPGAGGAVLPGGLSPGGSAPPGAGGPGGGAGAPDGGDGTGVTAVADGDGRTGGDEDSTRIVAPAVTASVLVVLALLVVAIAVVVWRGRRSGRLAFGRTKGSPPAGKGGGAVGAAPAFPAAAVAARRGGSEGDCRTPRSLRLQIQNSGALPPALPTPDMFGRGTEPVHEAPRPRPQRSVDGAVHVGVQGRGSSRRGWSGVGALSSGELRAESQPGEAAVPAEVSGEAAGDTAAFKRKKDGHPSPRSPQRHSGLVPASHDTPASDSPDGGMATGGAGAAASASDDDSCYLSQHPSHVTAGEDVLTATAEMHGGLRVSVGEAAAPANDEDPEAVTAESPLLHPTPPAGGRRRATSAFMRPRWLQSMLGRGAPGAAAAAPSGPPLSPVDARPAPGTTPAPSPDVPSAPHDKVAAWLQAPQGATSGLSDSLVTSAALDAHVDAVRAALPAGYTLAPLAEPLTSAAPAPAAPYVALRLFAVGRAVGLVLVCASAAARDRLAARVRAAPPATFPPRLGLVPPDAAPALCFSCCAGLSDALGPSAAGSLRDTARLIAELARALQGLHSGGYAVDGLAPGSFTKPGPLPEAPAWCFTCVDAVHEQGAALPRGPPTSGPALRWVPPERAVAAAAAARPGAVPGTTPPLIADSAADMFVLGLLAYRAATGRGYWDDMDDGAVATALLGDAPMPALGDGEGLMDEEEEEEGRALYGSPAAALRPVIASLLQRSAAARPLAAEVVAALDGLCPGVADAAALCAVSPGRASPPTPSPYASHATDAPTPSVTATSTLGGGAGSVCSELTRPQAAQPMDLYVTFVEDREGGGHAAERQARLMTGAAAAAAAPLRHSRDSASSGGDDGAAVFGVDPSTSYEVVICAVLGGSAVLPVFPLRHITKVQLVRCATHAAGGGRGAGAYRMGSGRVTQVLNVVAEEPFGGGTGMLVRASWDPAAMLRFGEAITAELQLTAQVLGYEEPILVSKELRFQCRRATAALASLPGSPGAAPPSPRTAVLDLVRLSQEHGLPFTAAVPLSHAAAASAMASADVAGSACSEA